MAARSNALGKQCPRVVEHQPDFQRALQFPLIRMEQSWRCSSTSDFQVKQHVNGVRKAGTIGDVGVGPPRPLKLKLHPHLSTTSESDLMSVFRYITTVHRRRHLARILPF